MTLNRSNQIFCLMGPTAAGKTQLALELVQVLPFEIISVDAAMVYRGMDIGTAKPTPEELKIAPHRLIDICDPAISYSAGQFREDVLAEIDKILVQGKIPLLVGGTMLYFKLLQEGLSKLPQADQEVRKVIAKQIQEQGLHAVYQELQKVDPKSSVKIKPTDKQRISRALEVFKLTGKSLSELQQNSPPKKLPYRVHNLALAPLDRAWLGDRINQRFQKMLKQGFIEEVRGLYSRGDLYEDLPSVRMVGYHEIWQYLSAKITYEQCLELIPIATRQLAKRQLTWLKSWSEIKIFDSEGKNLFAEVLKEIKINIT